MGKVFYGIPRSLVDLILEKHAVSNFVETGTFKGETAIWASRVFDNVITLEASSIIYKKYRSHIANYRNVKHIYGDSSKLLSSLLPDLSGNILFWLDAHWKSGDSFGEANPCPLLDELEAISPFLDRSIIFIDDARLFISPPSPPHDYNLWPNLANIVGVINSYTKKFKVYIIDDIILMASSRFCLDEILLNYQKLNRKKSFLNRIF